MTDERLSAYQRFKFRIKSQLLIFRKYLMNLFDPQLNDFGRVAEWGDDIRLLSASSSALWNENDNEKNRVLTAGKIQNLRIASKKIEGLHIPAGKVFSFWNVIGKPSVRNGFVEGREVREGCIIPTIGGGICQLSNALYDAANKAGFEIIERHRHTKVVKGSLAEQDRDATVKWNYVDLRFRSNRDFFIKIEFGKERYSVKFYAREGKVNHVKEKSGIRKVDKIHDCLSCGKESCSMSKNVLIKQSLAPLLVGKTDWSEFYTYMEKQWEKVERVNPEKYKITIGNIRFKLLRFKKYNSDHHYLFEKAKLEWTILAKQIPVSCKELIIPQYLLPFAYVNGDLWGRSYTVLMTRKPLFALHKELDAMSKNGKNTELRRFRASEKWVLAEKEALKKADNVVSPFKQLASFCPDNFHLLSWDKLASQIQLVQGTKVIYPYPAAQRYHLDEIVSYARSKGWELLFESNPFQREGIAVFNGDWSQVGMVLEDKNLIRYPHLQKKALALNIPMMNLGEEIKTKSA